MGALDFSGRQQLYYQLYNLLFQDIISGKYPVGCIIPAESELMNTYHVSRQPHGKRWRCLPMTGLSVRSAGTEPLSYRHSQYITTARSPLYKEKQSGSSYRRKTNDQSKSNESAQGYRGVSSAI